MKLLFIWIEEFRGIEHQSIVVDDEYIISVREPEAIKCDISAESKKAKTPLVDSYGQKFISGVSHGHLMRRILSLTINLQSAVSVF